MKMKKCKAFVEQFELNLVTVLLPLMCLVVLVATFGRFTKLYSSPWAEELSRYTFIWIVFLGVVVGAKRESHFRVDALVNALPEVVGRVLYVLRTLIVLAFYAFIFTQAIKILRVQIRMEQTSPSMHIPMWIAYGAIPVGMALSFVWTIVAAVRSRLGRGERGEDADVS